MAYKRDLSKPLAETFGPGDRKVGDQKNAPHSALIGKGLGLTAIMGFIGKIGSDKMKKTRAERLEKRDARRTKRKN